MKSLHRRGRNVFLAYFCGAGVAILAAAPLVSALEPAAAGASGATMTFERADRNRDGFLSLAEASALPGLGAAFARSDASFDGRLDKVEFARALALAGEGR